MQYTIKDFWIPLFKSSTEPDASTPLAQGWSFQDAGLPTFKEAPLTLSPEANDDDSDPEHARILLISAPGAVGKTTLARQIAYETHSVYINLAIADPVGAYTLTGGLSHSKLLEKWNDQTIVTLIDGLDEARLRVTQEAFEAFLKDVAMLSSERTVPTVIFGRTAAVQDAWILLEGGVDVAVLEIGYYVFSDSVDLADRIIKNESPNRPYASAEQEAVRLLLKQLRDQTKNDESRFAGYAPVIHAVAKTVSGEKNPSKLISKIKKGEQPVTLKDIASVILKREHEKLGLSFQDPDLSKKLYTPAEQLQQLIARIYGLQGPQLPQMSAADAKKYSEALDQWVPEHPFLDGSGKSPSSAVFGAVISAEALRSSKASAPALERELGRSAAANPFLHEFYMDKDKTAKEPVLIPAEHIGVIYSSLRASLSVGDTANLAVGEVEEPTEEEEELRSDVEIVITRRDADPRALRFRTEQTDAIRLGAHVEDVDIVAPRADVVIGPGQEATLVSPINIQCKKLTISSHNAVVERSSDQKTAAVFLQAEEFDGDVASVPVCRAVELSCSWPGVQGYPWTSFATDPPLLEDHRVDEALNRFRQFVIVFRSHGKKRLARFRGKLEHSRMTKGCGQEILDAMVDDGIVTLEQPMYFLDAKRLAALTGMTYVNCMAKRFDEDAITFVRKAIGIEGQ